ncbi:MAG TPA: hypothetical protein VMT58_01490 [Candidatus Binataceae bacterium]|nr:hypothetical protein [Candidatus Binataceae bacterium]
MKPFIIVLTAVAIAFIASAGFAQDSGTAPQVMGTVVRGNTTIVFEAAGKGDLPNNLYREWDSFQQANPKIAHQLNYNPKLIDDAAYLKKHQELAKEFDEHPELLAAMRRDPGNFVAIPPRPGE